MMQGMGTKDLDSPLKICDKCKGKKELIVDMLGQKMKVPVMCGCEAQEYKDYQEEQQKKENMLKLEKLRDHSLMDSKFSECNFNNFEVDKENKPYFNIAKQYVAKFKEIEKENMGMMFYGKPGTGKTYLAFCIANELIANLTPVIAISSIGLLNKIKETYKRYGNEGEYEIIRSLTNASLLILDDLGAESNTEWAKEKLYEIIDSRYRDEKPIIITTNLTQNQLKNKLASGDGVYRTYDRIVEMCTQIEVKGQRRRQEAGQSKQDKLREMLFEGDKKDG